MNEAIRYLREQTRSSHADERQMSDMAEEEDPEVEDIPVGVIQDMIRQLPDGYRTVFNLFVFEEKSHKEISAMLGITESTSASQFHRAKNILAKKIKEYRKTIE